MYGQKDGLEKRVATVDGSPALSCHDPASTKRLAAIDLDQQPMETLAPNLAQTELVQDLFLRQVRLTPNAIAVLHVEQSVTYAELNSRANQLARYLITEGVGPDQLVGICVDRDIEMIVGIVAILKAGGAYLPLDPHYPADRLQYMLENAAPAAVLTQAKLLPLLPNTKAVLVDLTRTLKELERTVAEDLPAGDLGQNAANLVYVIYTSGSTGRPKGVAMAHGSMVNLIEWHRWSFGSCEGQRVLQFAALSFDVAFQEIFSTLCMGGTLVLLDEWIRRDPRALVEYLNNQSIHRLFLPPFMLQTIAEYSMISGIVPGHLRDVITAGEQLRVSPQIAALFKRLDGCRLHNHYGPTETHVVTALTLLGDPDHWPALPGIGEPIWNTQIYVLDDKQQPVSIGEVGEIYIGGAGVARGYLNQPELMAGRFVEDHFGHHTGARLYRTGDVGRWRDDGLLEYLGRNDQQVKIRGYRIELGEIEAQLATHARVRDVAAMVREDTAGDRRLVAYITPRDTHPPTAEELRTHLEALMPDYMVPSAFVVIDQLPITPTGKVDRRALPAPAPAAYSSRQYEAPVGTLEETLATIWRGILKIENVGRNDNFFELGGNSILVIQMIEKLRQAALCVDTRDVYLCRTLADVALTLRGEADAQFRAPPNRVPDGCRSITPAMLSLVTLNPEQIEEIVSTVPGGAENIQDIYPLTPLQQGLLFHHVLNADGGDTYVLPILLRVCSGETLGRFLKALQEVVQRHDSLRTAVVWERLPSPVQVVYRKVTLLIEELTLETDCDPIKQLRDRMSPIRNRLDLQRAPLVRVQVAADPHSDQRYVLLLLHHLTCDHESLDVMLAEVMAHLEGRQRDLPEPGPYRTHVWHTLLHAGTHTEIDFFRRKLSDVDEPTTPFGLSDVYGDGSQIDELSSVLDSNLSERVRNQARKLNVGAATMFHAGWGLVVSKTSGREDIVYGTLLSGRMQGTAKAGRVLGMFINTLPLRLRLQSLSAKELVEQTHRELTELLSHEQQSLASAQRSSGVSASVPLFSALLNYLHGVPNCGSAHPTQSGVEVLEIREWTNYPLVLSVQDQGEQFLLTAQTDRRVSPQRLLGYVVSAMLSLVEALEQAPETVATTLGILPRKEHEEVVDLFNATRTEYPRHKLIHELFQEWVSCTPHSVAIACESRLVTYVQLDQKANQLARFLISTGMAPGEFVPILMRRSVELIIAQLAVLKGGCAYVPLDPNMPIQRQTFMVQDCGAKRILAAEERPAGLEFLDSVHWIDYTTLQAEIGTLQSHTPARLSVTRPPAYAMYTSGSTGVPKGVVVPHTGPVRLALENGYARIEATDVVAHCSNPAFDASTFEVWGALLNGASLLIVSQPDVLDAGRLAEVLRTGRASILFLTVGLFTQYVDALADVFKELRYLITGGDVVDPSTIRRVLLNSAPRHLLNAYGPTECTAFATTCLLDYVAEGATSLPIGRPISNTQVYILDRHLQPVPIGVCGEIYIGGDGVALGYLNRPELTAEQFVPNPFSHDTGARMYKSGDLGRWRADGNVEFLGRNDNQVKIRGFRIEPGEIEARLLDHPGTREAAVVARVVDEDKFLIAYLTLRDGSRPTAEELRRYLKTVLPEYMVPSAFVILESMPLTPNGKIDRRALPSPPPEAYARRPYAPPQGEVEEALAHIWRDVLRLTSIGRHDNFFELGGHSISATQAIARMRSSLSLELPLSALFGHPTIEELSAEIFRIRRDRLLARIKGGGLEMKTLLKRAESIQDSEIRELVRDIAIGVRP